MVQATPASDLTLHDVEAKFGLRETEDQQFFLEWQTDLPELTELERQALAAVKASFLYLNKYPMSEEAVKLVVLSPLLAMAGFYQPPFQLRTEVSVQIALSDEGELVRGRIDVLILQERFWVLVVESKAAGFGLKQAIAKALAYMAVTPSTNQPAFGYVTNGSEFRFLKLTQQNTSQYAFSDLFTLQRRENDLEQVLRVLKCIGSLLAI